ETLRERDALRVVPILIDRQSVVEAFFERRAELLSGDESTFDAARVEEEGEAAEGGVPEFLIDFEEGLAGVLAVVSLKVDVLEGFAAGHGCGEINVEAEGV